MRYSTIIRLQITNIAKVHRVSYLPRRSMIPTRGGTVWIERVPGMTLCHIYVKQCFYNYLGFLFTLSDSTNKAGFIPWTYRMVTRNSTVRWIVHHHCTTLIQLLITSTWSNNTNIANVHRVSFLPGNWDDIHIRRYRHTNRGLPAVNFQFSSNVEKYISTHSRDNNHSSASNIMDTVGGSDA